MIYEKINYSTNISYLSNTMIYEYDISKANINILYTKGAIDKNTYDYLYNSERMVRQKYIGTLQGQDENLVKILQQGIIEAKQKLFESNNIQDYEVLSIKNDAVFIINRRLNYTKFGLVEFKSKNEYTSFYKVHNIELYYNYNMCSNNEILDIKGIGVNNIPLHQNFMIQFLKDLFYTIQVNGVEIALRMMKDFYHSYITLSLPIGFYRKFSSDSTFHIKTNSTNNSGFSFDNLDEQYKNILDISYNASVLLELNKILYSIYFQKYK